MAEGQGIGGGAKRTELQREEDLARIARLDRRGHNNTAIAKIIGISRQQVATDKKLLLERYREEQAEETAHRIDKMEAQYNDMLVECWKAYEHSKEESKKVVEKVAPRPIKDKDGNPTGESITELVEIATTTEERLPAVEYMNLIERILKAKRDLYGLDSPKKIEMKRLTIDFEQLMKQVNEGEANEQLVEDKLESLMQEIPKLPAASTHQTQTNGLPNGLKELLPGNNNGD